MVNIRNVFFPALFFCLSGKQFIGHLYVVWGDLEKHLSTGIALSLSEKKFYPQHSHLILPYRLEFFPANLQVD